MQAVVSEVIFDRIIACDTPKEAWDKLKEEFQGNEKTRQMQVLNLRREFELFRIKDYETIKEYAIRLFKGGEQYQVVGGRTVRGELWRKF